jgi:hypothetical protein
VTVAIPWYCCHVATRLGHLVSFDMGMTLEGDAENVRWARLNTEVLTALHASVAVDQAWLLFSCWRFELTLEQNTEQHVAVIDGLSRGSSDLSMRTVIAHYRLGADGVHREPWLFVIGSATRSAKPALADWLCKRFRRAIAFWGDQLSVHAVMPEGSRRLGKFAPGAIAHAVCESSPEAATFRAFAELPSESSRSSCR